MKIYDREKRQFVRIIIGDCEEGMSGVKAPTKTINVSDTNVPDVYGRIIDLIGLEKVIDCLKISKIIAREKDASRCQELIKKLLRKKLKCKN